MLNKNTTFRCLLLFSCVAVAIASTGCRSMPGRNLFGFRSQPSPETLAGSGPSSTYPIPPSATATPEAIASVAGGTAPTKTVATQSSPPTQPTTEQVAGFDVSSGFASPASNTGPTNMAAAQANGIFSGSPTNGSDPAVASASGYTFGTKALTPKTATNPSAPSTGLVAGQSAYNKNSSFGPPISDLKTPSTSYSLPPSATAASIPAGARSDAVVTKPAASSPTDLTPAGGYTLPTDSPAIASISPPTSDNRQSTAEEPANAFAPPAAISPDFSTASTDGSITAPNAVGNSTPKGPSASSGYMPGSTSADHGYPTGDFEPSNGGSFFR